jgi:hypothetical protein
MREILQKTVDELTGLLAQRVREMWDTYTAEDIWRHDAMFAEGYCPVDPYGSFHRRPPTAEEIAAAQIGGYRLTEMEAWPIEAEVALLRYLATHRFAVGDVWWKRGGEWKCRYYQATMMFS